LDFTVYLTALCCAWIAGIFAGSYFHLPFLWMASTLLCIPGLFLFKKQRKSVILVLLIVLGFTGGAGYYPHSLPADSLTPFIDQEKVTLQGKIASQPELNDTLVQMEVEIDSVNAVPVQGTILLFAPLYPQYHYGDSLKIFGKLQTAPQFPEFDYQAYLNKQGITATMLNPQIEVTSTGQGSAILASIYSLRDRLSRVLSTILPEPQASLAQGIVLGIRSSIPDDVKNQLSVSGTAHLLAISGINLSILAGILIALGIRLWGRRHYYYIWLALSVIWFYTVLTGWQPPVIRASIMASVFLFAELLGRQKYALPALALSAAIMIGLDPQVLWNISFQLSFLAMVGLIYITPLFQSLWQKWVIDKFAEDNLAVRLTTPLAESFCVTLGATIAVWPLIAFNFNIVSLIGPLATFLIGPVLAPIILLGALAALLGIFLHPLGQFLGWILWVFLSYMLVLVKFLAGLPAAALNTGNIPLYLVQIYFLLLAIAIVITANWPKCSPVFKLFKEHLIPSMDNTARILAKVPRKYILIPLLLIALLTTSAAISMPDQYLHVSFLDVGEGDATLIQSAGQNILIDGGPSPQAIGKELSQKLPFWERTIDLVILSHPHLDHLAGLIEVINRYHVKAILAPEVVENTAAYKEWMNLIKSKNIPLSYAVRGQQIKLSNGAILEILNPQSSAIASDETDIENLGIVLKVAYGSRSWLLTADIFSETESLLVKERLGLSCDVLKVSHHGSKTSSSADFLRAAHPQTAVISCGAGNLFGHPQAAILDRLKDASIYRTDLSGNIEFTSDGSRLWIKTAR
jgi:competence protein ComEC